MSCTRGSDCSITSCIKILGTYATIKSTVRILLNAASNSKS
jgi:hypothetical protein